MNNTVKVGVVLPITQWGDEERKNAQPALDYADEAGRQGVQLLVYPEGYPGPMTGSLSVKATEERPIRALQEKAKQHGMFIAAGEVEPNPDKPETYFLSLKLISDEGRILTSYFRTQPDTPPLNAYLYNGKAHLLPGKESSVVATSLGNIGLRICSELWVPELCRISMLRGAEILIAPVHGRHSPTLFNASQMKDTWRCIARARAAENLCYVVVTHNIYDAGGDPQSRLGAFIAGPEKMVDSREVPGLLVADLDMARLEYLRSRNYDEQNLSRPDGDIEPMGCRPGQIWERDPGLYAELAQPHQYSFNYRYFDKDLDQWVEEYDRIYAGKYADIQREYGRLQFR